MFARAHVGIAVQLVQAYKGELPFVHYLKNYFSSHKKHGSRDRKQIAQLCYCWFRLGKSLHWLTAEERMVAALFLCSAEPGTLLNALQPNWNLSTSLSVEEKLAMVANDKEYSKQELAAGIFPWQSELSAGIDPVLFACSHLQQPDLFIRVRPAYAQLIPKKLERSGWVFKQEAKDRFRLPNGTRVEELFELNKELVIQDLNSQEAGAVVDQVLDALRQQEELRIWDACAASGGKSIQLFDRLPGAKLTVTDIRPSILQNLYQRFKQAGLYSYEGFVADLSKSGKIGEQYEQLPEQDLILADLPCSGSGTWSRNPENLCFFDPAAIDEYASLQKKILKNLLPKLKPGAYLLYITCSVFRKENEAVIQWLKEQAGLQPLQVALLNGYEQKADSMFVALLRQLPG